MTRATTLVSIAALMALSLSTSIVNAQTPVGPPVIVTAASVRPGATVVPVSFVGAGNPWVNVRAAGVVERCATPCTLVLPSGRVSLTLDNGTLAALNLVGERPVLVEVKPARTDLRVVAGLFAAILPALIASLAVASGHPGSPESTLLTGISAYAVIGAAITGGVFFASGNFNRIVETTFDDDGKQERTALPTGVRAREILR